MLCSECLVQKLYIQAAVIIMLMVAAVTITRRGRVFIYLFMTALGLVAALGLSLAVVLGLLITVVFLVAEHRLQGMRASVVGVPGLSCPVACGIFPD